MNNAKSTRPVAQSHESVEHASYEEHRDVLVEFSHDDVQVMGDSTKIVLRLKSVPFRQVDWTAIGLVLEKSGIKEDDAAKYLDALADVVHNDQLSKLFAARAKFLN